MPSTIATGDIHCVLVGVQLKGITDTVFERSLRELEKLVDTLGYEHWFTFTQKRPTCDAAHIVGSGKLDEIKRYIEANPKVNALVFDCELSPRQQRNLEDIFGFNVMDRTSIILEIFHRRARTKEAKLQCELARLQYLSSRLRMTQQLDRQAGGIGAKGIGETQHELNKRRIRDRIAELNKLLKQNQKQQALRRQKRQHENRVVLFGYTNAGKSSLMRALTGQDIYVEDKLFATLDTKVRALKTAPKILITDTVGIIQNIPNHLIASFHATMEEAKEASLVLHVVDVSDDDLENQLNSGRELLEQLEVNFDNYLLVLNKIDALNKTELKRVRALAPKAILTSIKQPETIRKMIGMLEKRLQK